LKFAVNCEHYFCTTAY